MEGNIITSIIELYKYEDNEGRFGVPKATDTLSHFFDRIY